MFLTRSNDESALSLAPIVCSELWPVHRNTKIDRVAEDKLSYPVRRIIILSEDSPDIG